MPQVFNTANYSLTYTTPSPIETINIKVEGARGGDGGDGGGSEGQNGGSGGSGGFIQGDLSVSSNESFSVNIGERGEDGENGLIGDSGSAAGGNGGLSPDNDGGAGSDSQYDPGGFPGSDTGASGGAGGGGGGETRVIRDSDDVTMARSEAGGGGGGGFTADYDDSAIAGAGGGGARGGAAGDADPYNLDGQPGEGTGDGGGGGGLGGNGGDGGQQFDNSLFNVTTSTGGSSSFDGRVEITEHVYWPSANLTVSNHTKNSVSLTWSDSQYETEYTVEYRLSGGGWQQFSTLSSGSTSEQITGLLEGRNYDFRVTASNSVSSESYSVSQTTNLPVISDFTVSDFTETSASLSWVLNSIDESGIRVYRSESGSAFSQIANLSSGTEQYQDTGLLNATEYQYYLEVYTSDVTRQSNTVTVITDLNNPNNLQDVSDTRNRIDVTWDSDLNTGEFYIEYERLYDNSVQKSETVNYTTKSSFIDNVDDGVEYEVRVRSETSQTTGPFTSITTRVFVPHSRFTQKAIDGQGKVELQWEKIDTFDGGTYEVYRSETQGNLGNKIATLSDTITRYVDDNTEFNTEYYYTLRRVIE